MAGNRKGYAVRLSQSDLNGLAEIQKNSGFTDTSDAMRFCIHFSVIMLRLIPSALIESFLEQNKENER